MCFSYVTRDSKCPMEGNNLEMMKTPRSKTIYKKLILGLFITMVVLVIGCYLAFWLVEKPEFIEIPSQPPIGKWDNSEQIVETRKEGYARYSLYRKEVIILPNGTSREKIKGIFDTWLGSNQWVARKLLIPGPCYTFLSNFTKLSPENGEYHMYVRPDSIGADTDEPILCLYIREMKNDDGILAGFDVTVITANPSPVTWFVHQ